MIQENNFGIIQFTFRLKVERDKKDPFDNPTDAHRCPYDNPTQIQNGEEEIRLIVLLHLRFGVEERAFTPGAGGPKVQPGATSTVTPRVRIFDFFCGIFILLSTNESWIQFETRRQSCCGIDNK